MLHIPAHIANQFRTYIGELGIPAGQHGYYVKWMRYYLDFCHKYRFERGTDTSLTAYLNKLDEKEQSQQLQEQAEQAVRFYLTWVQSSKNNRISGLMSIFRTPLPIPPNKCRYDRQEYKPLETDSRQPRCSAM